MVPSRRVPRLSRRTLLPLLSFMLLLALIFTTHAVLAQPPALPPQDAPWTAIPIQVNSGPTSDDANNAPRNALAAAPTGSNIYAVWAGAASAAPKNVLFAASADGSVTWGSTVTVSLGTLTTVSDGPAVAAVGGATVHVAWPETAISGNSAVRYRRSTNSGATWDTEQRLKYSFAASAPWVADVAASGSRVFVGWKEWGTVEFVSSSDSGATWSAPATAFTYTNTTMAGNVALAADSTPSLYVAWDEGAFVADRWACFGKLLNGTTPQNQRCPVHLTAGSRPTDPDIALDPVTANRIYALYVDDSSGIPAVWHVSSSDSGATWGSPVRVSDPAYSATEPALVATAGDVLYATWTDARNGDDIFYSKSVNAGASWSTPGRVNPALSSAQRSSALAARSDGPRALWDSWNGTNWNIYASSIITNCPAPLEALGLAGPANPNPGTTSYSAVITPSAATAPVDYTWTPAPGAGQSTASASYNWPVPGSYPITVTASNCGGLVAASRTIVVPCTLPLTDVAIDGAGVSPVTAGNTVTLTAVTTPITANPVVTYTWLPTPVTGQGTATATYRWQAVGTYPITVTAANCGGPVTGTASLVVTDTVLPAWGAVSPAGWITATQSPTVTVVVSDAQSGLDVITGLYQYYNGSWSSGWTVAPVSGADYTTANQTLTAASVPFGRDSSAAGGQNRIRFQVRDMAGNLGASPEYTLTIDTLPPTNPAVISGDRPTSTWSASFAAAMTWSAATDAGSGVGGYSYLWSLGETDLPPAVISTTMLTAATLIPGYGQHWYFHVRAVDNLGHWSPTATHQGPYWVGNAPPAFLTLDPESSGPGAEVILTGFGFDPQVTVSIGFTSTGSTHWLGTVQTSWDGVFQAAATVPDTATLGTAHGFIAQGGGKTGRAKFNVTPGMQILMLTPQVNPGGYAIIKANYANKFGSLVLEMAGADYSGPFPMAGQTTKQASLQVPKNAIAGAHTITVTNRVDGYVVQRNTATFDVVVPTPPVPLTATVPTIQAVPTHGIRGTIVDVTGVAPSACRYFEIGGTTYLDCQDIALTLGLQLTTAPVSSTLKSVVLGSDIRKSTVEINPYTGQYTGTLTLKDEYLATFYNEPWGSYNLCLYSDHQNKYTGWEAPETVPQAAAQTSGPQSLVPQPTVTPVPVPGEQSSGQQTWVTHFQQTVACTPFHVDEPPRYVEQIRLADNFDQRISVAKAPQIVLHGTNTGYLTGTHPVKIRQTITQTAGPANMAINVAEGNYWIDAFACDYLPQSNIPVQNNGRGGFYPLRTIKLTDAGGLGPSPRGVSTDFPTALSSSGKLGPFMSFQGALYSPPPLVVPFTIWFNNNLEIVSAVTVTLPGGGTMAATHAGTDPDDATRDLWTVNLNVNVFPAGQVSATVTAFGHYKDDTSTCPKVDRLGAPWPIPIVMVPAPGWLTRPLANPSVSYDAASQTYFMSGRVGQGVPGRTDWTVIPAGVNLNYLGLIENKITAQVDVAETFNILSGEWKATLTKISGESAILCFPGDTGCKQTFPKDSSQLVASPPGGIVKTAADASMPNNYTWNGLLSSKSYGPWTVYQGIIASYWGIVNVNLSISFGASSQATMVATLLNDLNPNPIHIEPSATLNGKVDLWVDILLGVAAAGVSGQPYLTVGFPVDIISDTVHSDSPTICFGLNGEVWASMLWWEASFGPFEIFKTGACPGLAGDMSIMATTPPPSILPAPSLASDGYGHLLGTWIHNSSSDPGKNVGVMYYVYWDGATWSDGAPGIADPSFLISDPEVAFAGPGKALALFASNSGSIGVTKPVTWSEVTGQVSQQEIAYSVFNGLIWSAPQYLTNAAGPSGRVTLAGDPKHGRAMAAWVHDTSTTSAKIWIIEYAVYDALAGTWTPVGVASTPLSGKVLAEPNLAFNSIGEAALVFVSQGGVVTGTVNTPFNANNARDTIAFKWSPSKLSWTSMMLNVPKGALMPSVAFDLNDRPIVAYSLYDKDKGGGPTGIGNNNLLGYAVLTGTQWITTTHGTVRGVERPRIIPLKSDLAVILFRGFGAVNTPEFSGVPMAVTMNPLKPSQAPSQAGKLTNIAGWMYAGTSTGGSLVTLGVHNLVQLAPAAALSGASLVPAMSAGAGMAPFSGAADDVALMNVPVQADLSIAATDIQVGNTVPVSGTSVPVTVTVRNLGLAATTLPANLKLFQDEGSAGEKLLWSGATPPELLFMDAYTFTVSWHAVSGVHKLTARVYPALAEDQDGENNKASYVVGSPAPPAGLTVSVYSAGPVAGLAWTASSGSAISGYLVYRGVGTDPVQYVGQSTGTSYLDGAVSGGTRYRYAVSSFTDAGVESEKSAEASVLVPAGIYLPVLMRTY